MSQRDPFAVLGVEAGASAAEISAAYRKLARRHHPDQHPGDSPAERRKREAKMAEINAAHTALRDGWTPPPGAAPGRARAGARSTPGPARPRVTPPPPPRPQTEPRLDQPSGDPVSPWKVLTVLGVGVAVLVTVVAVIVIVISPETGPAPTNEQPVTVDVATWTVGTCVSEGPRAEAVRCEFPNRGMVVADVFTVDQCPAASDAYVLDPPRVLCIDFDA